VVRHEAPWLRDRIEDVSRQVGVPTRELELRALLHLPRLADRAGEVDCSAASAEISRLAVAMPREPEWLAGPRVAAATELGMADIPEETARTICERFHYLASHRPAGRYYGALPPEAVARPLAIVATTVLDVPSLEALVRSPAARGRARVVARVFAFPRAPRNTISRLLAFVARAEVQRGARQLLTYVNPNLGFTGTSYLASGWTLAGDEPGTRYLYVDGAYVTERDLARRFGSSDEVIVRQLLGPRFECSVMPLAPLLVFSRIVG